MTWLRPMSFGIQVEGVEIIGGPELQVMEYLAERIPQFEHKFESYPLKRNWYLIQNPTEDDTVYCFYGASYKAERETWGYFSDPTTILMPYPIVSLQNALDKYNVNGSVSLKQLFSDNLKTVLFDGAVNVWTEAVHTYSTESSDFLKFNVGHANAENLTSSLLKSRRIDFAYVGSSFKEIKALEQGNDIQFSVYSIKEFENKAHAGNRFLCAKNTNGADAVNAINQAMNLILSDAESSETFRDLNFQAIGYHPDIKPSYDNLWKNLKKPPKTEDLHIYRF